MSEIKKFLFRISIFFGSTNFFKIYFATPFLFRDTYYIFYQPENHVSVTFLSLKNNLPSFAPFLREISSLKKNLRFFARSVFWKNQFFFGKKRKIAHLLHFFALLVKQLLWMRAGIVAVI